LSFGEYELRLSRAADAARDCVRAALAVNGEREKDQVADQVSAELGVSSL
jgi:hypothetical protein